MSWPLPVISIATEFSDRIRRSSYQTNILKILINEIVEFVTVIEISYSHDIFAVLRIFSLYFFVFCINDVSSVFCRHLIVRSEEHTSELQSRENLVCRLLLEKKK